MSDFFKSAIGYFNAGPSAEQTDEFVGQIIDVNGIKLRVKRLIAEGERWNLKCKCFSFSPRFLRCETHRGNMPFVKGARFRQLQICSEQFSNRDLHLQLSWNFFWLKSH